MSLRSQRALVLGAGIQGVCASLALARAGHRVTLVDAAPDCLLATSGHGEGKIHLGLVYAHDPSFRTADLMLRSALSFAPLLEGFVGQPIDWPEVVSSRFSYVVARETMVPLPQLVGFYSRLDTLARERLAEAPSLHYLGRRPERFVGDPIPAEALPWVAPAFASHVVPTAEVAIQVSAMRALLRAALGRTGGIELRYGCRVESVRRTSLGFEVSGRDSLREVAFALDGDLVVNCLWAGRLRVDEQLGLVPRRPWLYRLKYRLLGDLPSSLSSLPAVTLVVGPYGDLVTYPSAPTYVSWYPRCLAGLSRDLAPPEGWDAGCQGRPDPAAAERMARASLREMEEAVPGLSGFTVRDVAAGVIFSWGRTDIDDPESELHERWDVGVHTADGYFSIDTGKLTCAPLFASRLVQELR